MNRLIDKVRPKDIVAFEKLATEVQLVNMSVPIKLGNVHIIFEDNNTKIYYLKTENVFVEDIIADKKTKQRFIITNIEATTFDYPVQFEEKKETKNGTVECRIATIKKYNPLG